VSARLDRLRERISEPLLVTSLVNIFYLTGFESSNAGLVIRPDGEPQLFTDFRYIEAAQGIPSVEVVQTKRALVRDLSERLTGRIAFEAHALPYSQYETLASGGLELTPTTGVVEGLRAVKDDDEVAKIRRATKVADRAFEALTAETWVGQKEKDVAWRLRQLMHAHGADDLSFDTAIAAGPNGSLPHADPGDSVISTHTLVVADFGARIDGYCSDCTRTVATGDLPKELRRMYDVCLEAQQACVSQIRAGMTGVDADGIAREIITRAGFGDNFGHGLGHGVGIEVHEAPRLSTESSDTLEAGNVVTIEPGIYLPGVGGVRIEDLAVVTDDGVDLLTSFPKELIDVG
jgi:Xaa-Pro aminopeptidase